MSLASVSRHHPLVVTALLASAIAACSSSTSSSTTTSASTTGAGGQTTASTTGAGGHGGGATGTGGAGGSCHGDASTWATLTTGPIACTKNSDCCVVVNGCLSQSQIVAATTTAQAAAAWPYCDSMCNDCIPPAIEVGCENGECAGKVVDFADASPDLLMDHCGIDPVVGLSATKLHFGCGGG